MKSKGLTITETSQGVGGFKPKSLKWEGYGYFLEQYVVLFIHYFKENYNKHTVGDAFITFGLCTGIVQY